MTHEVRQAPSGELRSSSQAVRAFPLFCHPVGTTSCELALCWRPASLFASGVGRAGDDNDDDDVLTAIQNLSEKIDPQASDNKLFDRLMKRKEETD